MDTLFSWSYKVLVPEQVNWNLLLVLEEIGQVRHDISTALQFVLRFDYKDKMVSCLVSSPEYSAG